MAETKVRIKDTGLNKVGGSLTYNQVDSGNWIDLATTRINYEFNTKTTSNEGSVVDSNGDLTFQSNEVSAIIPPRFTVSAWVLADDTQTIQNIIKLGRTQGVKRLTGGMGVISALPEKQVDLGTSNNVGVDLDYISVIVKNVTPSEVKNNSTEYIKLTIQMEQVK